MYYHCRPLKYVEYSKVYPPSLDKLDEYFMQCYSWLGHYCGFCPQIWLSRSHSSITGFRRKDSEDSILFGFDFIRGFFLSYDHWEYIMGALMNHEGFEKQNAEIVKFNNELVEDYKLEKEPLDGMVKEWVDCGKNLDIFLKKYLFIEKDQVVVPSLNLKVAKKIICRNERQKKTLRKMGFIEDRIIIKNIKTQKW